MKMHDNTLRACSNTATIHGLLNKSKLTNISDNPNLFRMPSSCSVCLLFGFPAEFPVATLSTLAPAAF